MLAKARNLFRDPAPLTAMDRTTSEAKLIVDEQARKRSELTASLKAARLAKEAADAATGVPAKKTQEIADARGHLLSSL